jgi:hypothetical protein
MYAYDRAKQADAGDRPAARAARGDPGLPQGRHGLDPRRLRRLLDKLPMGAAFNKALTLKMGQTHVHRYLRTRCSSGSSAGEIDPSFVITHRCPSRTRRTPTTSSATSRTTASRSCCPSPDPPKRTKAPPSGSPEGGASYGRISQKVKRATTEAWSDGQRRPPSPSTRSCGRSKNRLRRDGGRLAAVQDEVDPPGVGGGGVEEVVILAAGGLPRRAGETRPAATA